MTNNLFDELQKDQDRKKVNAIISDINIKINVKERAIKEHDILKSKLIEEINWLLDYQQQIKKDFKEYWKEEL